MKYKFIFTLSLLSLLSSLAIAQSGKPIVFDAITNLPYDRVNSFSEGMALVMHEGKYGYIDKTGALLIPVQYESAFDFCEGIALVMQDGKYGYIDKAGNYVIPAQYADAWNFSEGLAKVKLSGKWGYIDKSGTLVIAEQFDKANSFSEGLARVKQNGFYGYIDKTGKVAIPTQLYDARNFSDGLAAVDHNGKWVYIDKTGKQVIPTQFDDATEFCDGLARVKVNGLYGFIDKTGRFVIPAKFEEARTFSESLAVGWDKGKWGYIDKTGKFAIPAQFESAKNFSDGLARVKFNSKWGYIDKTGQFMIPADLDYADGFNSEDLTLIKKNGNWCYIGLSYSKPDMAQKSDYSDKFDNSERTVQTPKPPVPGHNTTLAAYVSSHIGTLESFLKANGIKQETADALRAKIEREIAEWQKKGEFEPTKQWKQRVNEKTRAAKIREVSQRISGAYNDKLQAVRKNYMQEYEKCSKEYCKMRSDAFAEQELVLRPYDADNETYLISTAEYGDILLPVPLSKAPAFKSNWENIKKSVEAVFVPSGNDVALQSVKFDKYVYDSNTKADYAQVDIDYNFGAIDVDNLNLNFDAIDVGTQSAPEVASVALRTVTPEQRKIAVNNASDVDSDIPEGTTNADNTFAVVIANGNYAHASKVVNAESDGRIMSQYLARTLGLPQRNITTQIDATYGQMVSAVDHLRDISEAYGKDEFNVIFYYVGHGLPDDNSRESYILPVDVDPRNIKICYPLETLYSELGSLGAKSVTVMIDACFSGANHGEGLLLPQSMGVTIKPKPNRPTGNMVVLSAAEGDETAFPYASQGHGLFTYWILKKLKESRGQVTLGELSDYVVDNVKKTSVIENRKRQTPTVATSPSLAASWRALPLISE